MKGRLGNSVHLVHDVTRLRNDFETGNVVLEKYGFVPWVRSGLSAGDLVLTDDGRRAAATVSLQVVGEGDGEPARASLSWQLTLLGPGDVTGIDGRQIIRRYPIPGATGIEATHIAHVEFDRPELPWLFSPRSPDADNNARLVPWLMLIVVADRHRILPPGRPELPQRIVVPVSELPDPGESWAFAHAQVKGDSSAGARRESMSARLSGTHARQNLSRLVCPRRLQPHTSYRACLVPVFDAGRQVGLGSSREGALDWAWTADTDGTVELPVYDHWTFRTGDTADFEVLARKLKGVSPPPEIGQRKIDMRAPGSGVEVAPEGPGQLQVLHTALVAPGARKGEEWSIETRRQLAAVVSREHTPGAAAPHDDALPLVSPTLYARFQRGQAHLALEDGDWFEELNSHPLNRVVAGLGTRVVQRDQDKLMEAAWMQVGEIKKANSALNRIKLGCYVATRYHRILGALPLDSLTQVTRPVHGKLMHSTGRTLHSAISASRVAPAAMTPAFRRFLAMRAKTAHVTSGSLAGLVSGASTFRDFRRPYPELSGIAGLDDGAITQYPGLIGGRLNIAGAEVKRTLVTERMTVGKSAVQRMHEPVDERGLARESVDIASMAANSMLQVLGGSMPTSAAKVTPQHEGMANVLLAVAAGSGDLANVASKQLDVLSAGLPQAIEPRFKRARANDERGPIPARYRRQTAGQLGGRAASHTRFDNPVSKSQAIEFQKASVVAAKEVATSVRAILADVGFGQSPSLPDVPALQIHKQEILGKIEPKATALAYAMGRFGGKLPVGVPEGWLANLRFDPIMAAPRFNRPMYEALAELDMEWLMAGIGDIPETDFVTVLETNPRFIETFLLGLSEEMGHELLWRGYSTDRRGTYFRRFWQGEQDELQQDTHRFARTPLGTHLGGSRSAGDDQAGCAVLVVKGDLIRRYPDLQCSLVRGGATRRDAFNAPPATGEEGALLFQAPMPPDMLCVGFDISIDRLKSSAGNTHWWFTLAEHPTAPRFGLDKPEDESADWPANHSGESGPIERESLHWRSLPMKNGFLRMNGGPNIKHGNATYAWASDAGRVAQTLFQSPVRAIFHAARLLG